MCAIRQRPLAPEARRLFPVEERDGVRRFPLPPLLMTGRYPSAPSFFLGIWP